MEDSFVAVKEGTAILVVGEVSKERDREDHGGVKY
jgi:hypothetical protein